MSARKIVNSSLLIVHRLIIFLLAFIFLLTVTSYLLPIAHAQDSTPSSTSKESPSTTLGTNKPTFEVSGTLPATISPTSPLYTDLLVNNLFHSFSCLAIGQSFIGQPCVTYQLTKNAQGILQGVPVLSQTNLSGGTLGAVNSVLTALYLNPPVRTADYLASVKGFGFVKEVHAQGVTGSGANVLSPVIALWQVSRNISYVIMIVVFLVIGIMIMFRNKINPQTVITAQAALPGLVIGLILITFSYFLAGLLSDMAFVGTNIVGYYFTAAQGRGVQDLVKDTQDQSVLSIVSQFTGIIDKDVASTAISNIWDSLSGGAQDLLKLLAMFVTAQTTLQSTEFLKALPKVGDIMQLSILAIAEGFTAVNPTAMIGLALAFIATAMIMYSMFKLLLKLINNYISIIFLTITAPFQFLMASLPGRQAIATGWVLNMLCNVLAFPAVFAALYFAAFLLGGANNAVKQLPFQISSNTTVTGTSSFPLFGGMDLNFINILLAFGVLIALPSIPDIICRMMGRAGVAGQMIGQELSGTLGQGRQYTGQFQRGIGEAAERAKGARGLFDEPNYVITGYKDGKPVYALNPHLSKVGFFGRLRARREANKPG